MESKILGTQQRFRTVVSTNLKNICSFFRVNLYRVYISRRVRFSNFLFVCVACVSFIVFVMCVFLFLFSFSCWCCLSPWNKADSFSNQFIFKWKWFHKWQHVTLLSFAKLGVPWAMKKARNQNPSGDRERIFLVLREAGFPGHISTLITHSVHFVSFHSINKIYENLELRWSFEASFDFSASKKEGLQNRGSGLSPHRIDFSGGSAAIHCLDWRPFF